VVLVGKTNVGKSTLMNTILGEKVSIVTPKPQTTRNRIMGVLTDNTSQIIFVDTPGFHRGKKELNLYMIKTARTARDDADVVTVMVEAADRLDDVDMEVIRGLKDVSAPVILLINKVDRAKKEEILPLIETLGGMHDFREIIPVSALTGDGIPIYLDAVHELLEEGPPYFPEDALTDQSEKFIAAEIIREKAFRLTRQEIPYAVAVAVDRFQEDPERGILVIDAVIYVERESQKGIIIGKGGAVIKEIGTKARHDLEAFFDIKVYIELRVKVLKDWAKRSEMLKRLGYQ
jgi:GTP-binding protein Era